MTSGKEDAVRLLLKRGHDVNERDARGRTALMYAAAEGHVGVCRTLLDAGADPVLVTAEGRDALGFASEHGRDAVVALVRSYLATPAIMDPAPSAEAATVEVDFAAWDEEPEDAPPRVECASWIADAARAQQTLAAHRPIDLSEDWSEVELALPSALHLAVLGEERASALRALLRQGLSGGILTLCSVEAHLHSGDLPGGAPLDPSLLRRVLEELAIEVEDLDEEDLPLEVLDGNDDAREREITEALNYLAAMVGGGDTITNCYRDAVRLLRRPSEEEERERATALRSACAECLRIIRTSPSALAYARAFLSDASVTAAPAPSEDEERTAEAEPSGGGLGYVLLAAVHDRAPWANHETEARCRFEQIFNDARDARHTLIEGHLWLVVWLAGRCRWSTVPLLDLVQEGALGLIRAIETFDPARGTRLSTYAGWWIRQAIAHAIPELGQTIRLPQRVFREIDGARRECLRRSVADVAASTGTTEARLLQLLALRRPPLSLATARSAPRLRWEDLLADEDRPTPEEAVLRVDRVRTVELALRRLKPRDRRILRLRNGLGCREHTLEEVGRILSLTRERVRQIESAARDALASAIRRHWTLPTGGRARAGGRPTGGGDRSERHERPPEKPAEP